MSEEKKTSRNDEEEESDSWLAVLGYSSILHKKGINDWVDVLNSKYTVWAVVCYWVVRSIVASFLSSDDHSDIKCFAPPHFTDGHANYTAMACWIMNTYYVPFADDISLPISAELKKVNTIAYYQWIAFILPIQALFFYLPEVFWRWSMEKGCVDLKSLHDMVESKRPADEIAKWMIRFIHRDSSGRVAMGLSRRYHFFLCSALAFTKMLFLANLIFQLYLIRGTFFPDFPSPEFWENTYAGFPLVTMCDFSVRRLGNVNNYTVQCVLPQNLYNSRFYTLLAVWMCLLLVLTAFSLCDWILRMACCKERFLQTRLMHAVGPGKMRKHRMERFVRFLTTDGVLALRLLHDNTTNVYLISDVTAELWEAFIENEQSVGIE